jgi:hypothetical protein
MRNKGYVLTGFVVVIFVILMGMVMLYSTSTHQSVQTDYREITIIKAQSMSRAISGVLEEANSVSSCVLILDALDTEILAMGDALPVTISSLSCSGNHVDVESKDGETISLS